MNDLRGHAPERQARRGIAVVLLALLVPPGRWPRAAWP
jgi:hypothetical protein